MANSIKTGLDQFDKAPTEAIPRLIWSGFGEEGTGKTTFALTAPGPIVVFTFDYGLEGVVEPFARKKDIRVCKYNWEPSRDIAQETAVAVRDQFKKQFIAAVTSGARTLVIDKETLLWEVFRYAEFGMPNGAPREYGPLKQEYRKLFNLVKESTLNLGVIQSMKSPWEAETKPTGKTQLSKSKMRERTGMDEIGAQVNVNIEHYRNDAGFFMKLYKAKGPAAEAVHYRDWPFMDVPTLGGMLFPDSPDSAWE